METEIRKRQHNTDRPPQTQLYTQILAGYPSVSRPDITSLQPVGNSWEGIDEILLFVSSNFIHPTSAGC